MRRRPRSSIALASSRQRDSCGRKTGCEGMTDLNDAVASHAGAVKITAVRAMRLDDGFCLIRVDTDAGVSGYGECGDLDGDLVHAVVQTFAAGGGRLPHMQVLSGIDMALCHLSGKLLSHPVY